MRVWSIVLVGRVVGRVEAPWFEDMFWNEWRVVPATPECEALLTETESWDRCRFTFVDPLTGRLGTSWAGGLKPERGDLRVTLRWFHWA